MDKNTHPHSIEQVKERARVLENCEMIDRHVRDIPLSVEERLRIDRSKQSESIRDDVYAATKTAREIENIYVATNYFQTTEALDFLNTASDRIEHMKSAIGELGPYFPSGDRAVLENIDTYISVCAKNIAFAKASLLAGDTSRAVMYTRAVVGYWGWINFADYFSNPAMIARGIRDPHLQGQGKGLSRLRDALKRDAMDLLVHISDSIAR